MRVCVRAVDVDVGVSVGGWIDGWIGWLVDGSFGGWMEVVCQLWVCLVLD